MTPPDPAAVLYAQLAVLTRYAESGFIGKATLLRSHAALAYARLHGVEVPLVEGETPEPLRGWHHYDYEWNQR